MIDNNSYTKSDFKQEPLKKWICMKARYHLFGEQKYKFCVSDPSKKITCYVETGTHFWHRPCKSLRERFFPSKKITLVKPDETKNQNVSFEYRSLAKFFCVKKIAISNAIKTDKKFSPSSANELLDSIKEKLRNPPSLQRDRELSKTKSVEERFEKFLNQNNSTMAFAFAVTCSPEGVLSFVKEHPDSPPLPKGSRRIYEGRAAKQETNWFFKVDDQTLPENEFIKFLNELAKTENNRRYLHAGTRY